MPTSPRRPRWAALARARSTSKPMPSSTIWSSIALRRARTRTEIFRRRARALADVGQLLLDRAEHGDPLRGRERVRVAPDLELGADARALREAVHLAVEDLAERARDDALRLEGVGYLAQLPVELDEPGREVVEAPVRLLAVVLEDERIDLLLEQLDVTRKREDVLDGPVVEVEAEAHQAPFSRRR